MKSKHYLFSIITGILDKNSNTKLLENELNKSDFNYDDFVKLASNHLVLPAIYCQLKQKKILNSIPEELNKYLEKITEINRNRNQTLLQEINELSSLLRKNNIKHSFLKGAALLAGDYYNNIGERMIGDIDILVENTQLKDAQSLLLNHNYYELNKTISDNYFEKKHLPRLVSDNKLAAVELHQKLLTKNVNTNFGVEEYLKKTQIINNIKIGCNEDLIIHSIYNCEINDKNYYFNSINLRSLYDFLILKEKKPTTLTNATKNCKYINFFIWKANIYTTQKSPFNKSIINLKPIIFHLKTKNATIDKISYHLFDKTIIIKELTGRFLYFLANKSYRRDVINDRQRIFITFKKRFFKK